MSLKDGPKIYNLQSSSLHHLHLPPPNLNSRMEFHNSFNCLNKRMVEVEIVCFYELRDQTKIKTQATHETSIKRS